VRKHLILAGLALCAGLVVVGQGTLAQDDKAAAPGKPDTHDGTWLLRHGQASRVDEASCLQCHTDRATCIQCHQDVQPRNHTPSWVRQTHGLEARWSRETCMACPREDSCVSCHEATPPSSHRAGWSTSAAGGGGGQHCLNCHYPVGDTTCFTCHKVAHEPGQYTSTGSQSPSTTLRR
jgi:hypothetical protein